jgi:hypothetical protein
VFRGSNKAQKCSGLVDSNIIQRVFKLQLSVTINDNVTMWSCFSLLDDRPRFWHARVAHLMLDSPSSSSGTSCAQKSTTTRCGMQVAWSSELTRHAYMCIYSGWAGSSIHNHPINNANIVPRCSELVKLIPSYLRGIYLQFIGINYHQE